MRVHKSRMTYGWDFCPRLVHQGIWQSVSVEGTGPARITRIGVGADRVTVDASGNDSVELTLTDTDGHMVTAAARTRRVRRTSTCTTTA